MGILDYKFTYFNLSQNDIYCFNYENTNALFIHKDEVILQREQQTLINIFNSDKYGIKIIQQGIRTDDSLLYSLSNKKKTNIKIEDSAFFKKLNNKIKIGTNQYYVKDNINSNSIKYYNLFTKENIHYDFIDNVNHNYKNESFDSVFNENICNISSFLDLIHNRKEKDVFFFDDFKYYDRFNHKKGNIIVGNNDKELLLNRKQFELIIKKSVPLDRIQKKANIEKFVNKYDILFANTIEKINILNKPLQVNMKENRKIYLHKYIKETESGSYSEKFLNNQHKEKYFAYKQDRNTLLYKDEILPFHKIAKNGKYIDFKIKNIHLFNINRKLDVQNYDKEFINKVIKNYNITSKQRKLLYNKRNIFNIISYDNNKINKIFNKKSYDTSSPIYPNTPFLVRIKKIKIYDTSNKKYKTTQFLESIFNVKIYDMANNNYNLENYLYKIQDKVIYHKLGYDLKFERLVKTTIRNALFDDYKKYSFKYLTKESNNMLMPSEKDIEPFEKTAKNDYNIIFSKEFNFKKANIEKFVNIEKEYIFDKNIFRILNTKINDTLTNKNISISRYIDIYKREEVFNKQINKRLNNDFDKSIFFNKNHNQKEMSLYKDFYIKKDNHHIQMEESKVLQQVDKTLLIEQTQKNIELYNTLWMIKGIGETDLKIIPNTDADYPVSIDLFYEKPDFTYYFEYLSLHDIYIDGKYIIELYDFDYNIVSVLNINGVKEGNYNNDVIRLNIEKVPLNELKYEQDYTQFKFSIKVQSPQVNFIIIRQPIKPNQNIVLYTVTERFLADYGHPIPFGNDLGTKEIPIHVNIMIEFINILLLIWQKRFVGFSMHTGTKAIEGLLKIVHQWLTLEPSLEHESIKEYHRCYRWLRWEAEKVYNVAKQDVKLNGNKWIRELMLEMIDYLEMHHIDVVPILNDIRDTDEWRNIYSDPTFDINVLLNKEKGERKQLVDNRLRLTSAKTQ